MTIQTTHTAAKEYRCDAGFTCVRRATLLPPVIEAGQRYNRIVYPPWTLVREDPEYPATKLGEWITYRYHLGCYYP